MLALDLEEINIHVVCILTRTGGDVSYSWYCLIRASRVS